MKKEVKERAILLRTKERLSLKKIAEILKVSKGTVSLWLREYPLNDEEVLERMSSNGKKDINLAKLAEMRKKSLENRTTTPYEELTTWESKRRRIFKERGRKCEVCGWQEVNPFCNTVPVQIHHINGNNKDHRTENLIVLCPNCHSLTDKFMNYRSRRD